MKKRFITAIASLLLIVPIITLSGCADTSWAIKVNGEKVPSGMYVYSLMSITATILEYSDSASSDVWTQKIDNTDAQTWAINQAIKYTAAYIMTEKLCAQEKITLTSTEKSAADSQASATYSSATSALSKSGVSLSSLDRILEDSQLATKLYNYYYGTSGTKTISDTDFKTYCNDYVHVKHIFFNNKDDENNALTGSALQAVKDKANSVLAMVKKDPSKFDALAKKYSEDTNGLSSNPDGYTFKKGTTEYVTDFVTAAGDMKIGEIRLVTSTLGLHIMYKLALNNTTMLTQYKQDQFQSLLDTAVSKATIVQNASAINAYTPKKISANS
ncbi:MAG: peptidylprolyl isomerase [Clostridia bacterium]|nr:peptidylprolyl isomerase [Clostridia bacterium]